MKLTRKLMEGDPRYLAQRSGMYAQNDSYRPVIFFAGRANECENVIRRDLQTIHETTNDVVMLDIPAVGGSMDVCVVYVPSRVASDVLAQLEMDQILSRSPKKPFSFSEEELGVDIVASR